MANGAEAWKKEIKSKNFDREKKMGRQYVKQKKLGAGAFGEGWLCQDRLHKRMAVVKIAHGSIASEKEEYNAKKEVAIMEAMDHPNVVKFYEAWVEVNKDGDERLHISMEYCDAGDIGSMLKTRLKENESNQRILAIISKKVHLQVQPLLRDLTPDSMLNDPDLFHQVHNKVTLIAEKVYADVLEKEGRLYTWSLAELESWLVQLLWGLWYIHKMRVVHRDIKPDNVFLAGGGKIIKIGDFGISGLQAHTNALMQTRAGTPLYMAPEMWEGHGSYTDRCDVYALGMMFYELCSLVRAYDARLPFSERWGGAFASQHLRFLKRQITSPSVRPLAVPQQQIECTFFEVVKTMLRKDPKVRPTAGQVLRSVRIQVVARRVIDILSDGTSDDPLIKNSDLRHKNVHNPTNNHFTMHHTARFQCSSRDSEVLMMTCSSRLSIRTDATFKKEPVGYLTFGDIVEVYERCKDKEGTRWIRTQAGWCITAHEGTPLFERCAEDLLCRDDEGVTMLGAYENVVKDVQSMLKDALRVKLDKQRLHPGAAADEAPSSASPSKRGGDAASKVSERPRRTKSPVRAPTRVETTPTRRASNSPVVKRLSQSPAPAAREREGEHREKDRGHRHHRASPAPPTVRQRSPVRAPSTPTQRVSSIPRRSASPVVRRQEARDKELRNVWKAKVIDAMGKEAAKAVFQEYFKVYGNCVRKGMKSGSTCTELKKFEAELEKRMANDAYLVGYLRECAKLHY